MLSHKCCAFESLIESWFKYFKYVLSLNLQIPLLFLLQLPVEKFGWFPKRTTSVLGGKNECDLVSLYSNHPSFHLSSFKTICLYISVHLFICFSYGVSINVSAWIHRKLWYSSKGNGRLCSEDMVKFVFLRANHL